MSEIDSNIIPAKPHTGILAVISFALALSAIFTVVASIRRVKAVQHLPNCPVTETPGYRVVHNLCTILPTGSLAAGIVAIIRMFRGRNRVWTLVVATSGVVISLIGLVLYWINLGHLASGHVH